MYKKPFLILLICACCINIYAQQKPQYTQYVFNNYLLNPAVTGIENYTDTKLGYRSQWTGLQGAPVTAYFSINAPLGSNFLQGDAAGFPGGGGVDPASRSYTQDYRASEPHHGVGFAVVTDKAGPITQTNLSTSYAYHLGLTDKLNLAVGVQGGFNHLSLNTSMITLENPNDPTINTLDNNQWKPDAGAGVWLYGATYYLGASVQQLLPQTMFVTTATTATPSKTVPHYFVTAGYKFYLNDDVSLMPSALLKIISPVPTTYDINMKLSFRDKLWFGASVRKGDSYSFLAGFNLSSLINVGYSYDVTTSALNTVSNGTHELVLGIMLNNRYKLGAPQHGW